MERIDRRERTGASWRDLEQAKVIAQRHEFIEVEFINEDVSRRILGPNHLGDELVRLPYDHIQGRNGLLMRHDEEWIALPYMAIDTPETKEE